MEVNNVWGMFVSELTVEELMSVLFAALFFVVIVFIIAAIIVDIIKIIFSLMVYLLRKDKYKQYDFAAMRAYRQIASLRKQVKTASSEKAYYMFYNRLLGAVQFAREMGYISEHNVLRLIDVKCNFVEKETQS